MELDRDHMAGEINRRLNQVGCKLEYFASSLGSLYYRVVTTCEEEFRLFDKIRFSDHEGSEQSEHSYSQFDFVEGEVDFETDANMLIEQCVEMVAKLPKAV